jgi:hypothetical protein
VRRRTKLRFFINWLHKKEIMLHTEKKVGEGEQGESSSVSADYNMEILVFSVYHNSSSNEAHIQLRTRMHDSKLSKQQVQLLRIQFVWWLAIWITASHIFINLLHYLFQIPILAKLSKYSLTLPITFSLKIWSHH